MDKCIKFVITILIASVVLCGIISLVGMEQTKTYWEEFEVMLPKLQRIAEDNLANITIGR